MHRLHCFHQCFGSGSDFALDPHSIGFLDPDLDPGGVKSAKTEGKIGAKRQKIHQKKLKLVYESIF
jgi:hypothetical protein